jgi:pimeloyl-ACP methyl ester carboxylesterase
MWASNLPDLAATRTTYALDALGDAGLSVQNRAISDAADQADWLDQALAQLPVRNVHLLGHSFGGWLAANYAVRHPERVQTLSLLDPVFVFQGCAGGSTSSPCQRRCLSSLAAGALGC